MECKFVKHGIAISYNHVVKPCCEWRSSPEWASSQHISKIDLSTWHQSDAITRVQNLLAKDIWPESCQICEKLESKGRYDSMRYNGIQAYSNFNDDDITLEIRPGSTCNFACQTCWPEASSRVAQYQAKAGLIDIKQINSQPINDFGFLNPIKHRIKQVVLLGGEPFYDKSCLTFLYWAKDNLNSRITMFTNGSNIDYDFIKNYPQSLCIVVSIDAIGQPAEYIRFGTQWQTVHDNFQQLKTHSNVELRVNITLSIYNYYHLPDLINLLCSQWPACVTFGQPSKSWLNETSLPPRFRDELIDRLKPCLDLLNEADIEIGQKHNAINTIRSVIHNLSPDAPWSESDFEQWKMFVEKMDQVKNIRIQDYCEFLSRVLEQPI